MDGINLYLLFFDSFDVLSYIRLTKLCFFIYQLNPRVGVMQLIFNITMISFCNLFEQMHFCKKLILPLDFLLNFLLLILLIFKPGLHRSEGFLYLLGVLLNVFGALGGSLQELCDLLHDYVFELKPLHLIILLPSQFCLSFHLAPFFHKLRLLFRNIAFFLLNLEVHFRLFQQSLVTTGLV